jgi:hypothetical protein
MFVIECLAVMAAAFWLSALVAEMFMTSPAERALWPGVRVGFGFILLTLYFSAAWQVATIGQAWIAGLALLALHAVSREAPSGRWAAGARAFWSGYRGAFAAFGAAAALFFVPLFAAKTYGPFTEGGGDVSIYADTAKYMVDHELTQFGLRSESFDDFMRNLDEVARQGGGARPGAEKSPLMNPPFPEYGAYRILVTRTMSPFLYAPYAMFTYPAQTNYPVFYAILTLMYAVLLGASWSFFSRYGRRMAIAGVTLVALSHSLVSVYYNTYAAQAMALAMSALVLAALAHVRLLSWAALRTYGAVLVITWIVYVHYLSVLLPMVAVALIAAAPREPAPAPARAPRRGRELLGVIPLVVFALAFGSLVWAGTLKSVHIGLILLQGAFSLSTSKEILMYMGAPVPTFGTQWFAFVAGLSSQQHFMPYSGEYPPYYEVLHLGSAAATIAFVLGLAAMARWAAQHRVSWRPALQDGAIYAAALVTVVVHIVLVRSSLYTQAKGAQNVLVLIYVLLLLPLALLMRDVPQSGLALWLRRGIVASLVALSTALLFVRVQYAERMGLQLDRSGILEASYFDEARRIRAADPQALVLFEPRKSADLYMSNQPFFGGRMLPTRDLVLQKSITKPGGAYDSRVAMAVEFVDPDNLAHVWTLRAARRERFWWLHYIYERIPSTPVPYLYEWRAERLLDHKEPVLVLSGDGFERPYGKLPLGIEKSGEPALFSFMRNGVISLYIPPGAAPRVDIELHPRQGEYPLLEGPVRQRFEAGEFGPEARFSATGKVVRLSYQLPRAEAPTLRTIMRHKGEFFVNVKVDGRDLE